MGSGGGPAFARREQARNTQRVPNLRGEAAEGGVGRVGSPCRNPRRGWAPAGDPPSPDASRLGTLKGFRTSAVRPPKAGWEGGVVRAEIPEGDGLRRGTRLRPTRAGSEHSKGSEPPR